MNAICIADFVRRCVQAAAVWFLAATLATSPLHAEETKTQSPMITFHVDLLNDNTEPAAADLAAFAATEFELIGVPVKFGAKRGTGDGRLGLEAGLHADYAVELNEQLAFGLAGSISKTGYLEDSWGTDLARAAAFLRYNRDGLRIAFEPSWRIAMVETMVTERDFGAGLRVERDLADGFSLAAGVHYGGHDTAAENDGYARADTFTGLSYRMGPRTKFDFTFKTTYTLSVDNKSGSPSLDDLRYAASDIGPAIAMSFPIFDSIDLTAIYRYCRSTDELPRYASNDERRVEDTQSFDLNASWRSDDPTYGGISLTATYGYERMSANAPGADEEGHTAVIAFAMPF